MPIILPEAKEVVESAKAKQWIEVVDLMVVSGWATEIPRLVEACNAAAKGDLEGLLGLCSTTEFSEQVFGLKLYNKVLILENILRCLKMPKENRPGYQCDLCIVGFGIMLAAVLSYEKSSKMES